MSKISAKRESNEGCATNHRLKWGSLSSNDVSRIAQQVKKREVNNEGKGGVAIEYYKKKI